MWSFGVLLWEMFGEHHYPAADELNESDANNDDSNNDDDDDRPIIFVNGVGRYGDDDMDESHKSNDNVKMEGRKKSPTMTTMTKTTKKKTNGDAAAAAAAAANRTRERGRGRSKVRSSSRRRLGRSQPRPLEAAAAGQHNGSFNSSSADLLALARGAGGLQRMAVTQTDNPFAGLDADEYLARLRRGERWEMPVPDATGLFDAGGLLGGVCCLAEQCWQIDPGARPSVRRLRGKLQRLGDAACAEVEKLPPTSSSSGGGNGDGSERRGSSQLRERKLREGSLRSSSSPPSSSASSPTWSSSSSSSSSSSTATPRSPRSPPPQMSELEGQRSRPLPPQQPMKMVPMPQAAKAATGEAFDDWATFLSAVQGGSEQQEGGRPAMLVNAAPLQRRKQQEGRVDVEDFYRFQYRQPSAAEAFVVAVVSDGVESVQVRENQRRYHPDQAVFAIDLRDDASRKGAAELGRSIARGGHVGHGHHHHHHQSSSVFSSSDSSYSGARTSKERAAGVDGKEKKKAREHHSKLPAQCAVM